MHTEAGTAVDIPAALQAARADLIAKPDGVLEAVAEKHGLSLRSVLSLLPDSQATAAKGVSFDDIWSELTSWGTVLFLIHNAHGVFEIKTALPSGSRSSDYFNIHGEAPLGGHLRADRCGSIWFVDRPFFGRRACSILFLDTDGASMFKIYVRRGPARELDPEQLEKFETLRHRFQTETH